MKDTGVGEVFMCEREPHTAEDHYAVAVKKIETILGHLPYDKFCSLLCDQERWLSVLLQEQEIVHKVDLEYFVSFFQNFTKGDAEDKDMK